MAELVTIKPARKTKARVNFIKSNFLDLLWTKGYSVVHEKALECPCKSKSSKGQLSDCSNCGGGGWVFINPVRTRMILHSANRVTEYKEWSADNIGTVNVSADDSDRLSYMDRITLEDAEATHNEVIHISRTEDTLFSYTDYRIKEIETLFMFVDKDQKLTRLKQTEDFTFDKKGVLYLDEKHIGFFEENKGITLSLRYIHPPQYHIIDMTRHVMNTFVKEGGRDKSITMPVSAIGRVPHNIEVMENISNTRIMNNSYNDEDCTLNNVTCSK